MLGERNEQALPQLHRLVRTHSGPTVSRRWIVVAVSALVLVSGCTANGQQARERPTIIPTPAPRTAEAAISEVSPKQWAAMKAAGMVRPECPIQQRTELRSIRINFVDFEDRVRRGQLVVNADVANSVVRIFTKLFDARFPIRRMRPVEAFDGDTNASLRADNTSAFNCRRADQINAPFKESPHANGRAVDINPRENPWMDLRCDCWFPTARFQARQPGPGVILRKGVVWRAFVAEGWIWQDIDVPDYMHFDTGYPSEPYQAQP